MRKKYIWAKEYKNFYNGWRKRVYVDQNDKYKWWRRRKKYKSKDVKKMSVDEMKKCGWRR